MSNRKTLARSPEDLVKAQAARLAAKKLAAPPTVSADESRKFMRGTAEFFAAQQQRLLQFAVDARKEKKHLWIGLSQFRMDEEVLLEAVRGGPKPGMTHENLVGIHIGCFCCEQVFQPGLIGTICPGEKR